MQYLFPLIEIFVFLSFLYFFIKYFGAYMVKVFNNEKTFLDPILCPIEKTIYFIVGVNPEEEQKWTGYTISMLVVNFFGFLFLYLILRFQSFLPFNPHHLKPLSPVLAFNTAVSFITNTNWQSYSPEINISYFSEMVGLTVQNFLSAATGLALAIAFVRAFCRSACETIGNFYKDFTRSILWVFLPLAIIFSIFLTSEGVIQNLNPPVVLSNLEGYEEKIYLGPVASRESIKVLGTNGGGFFNANSSHPFENPTPLTNFLQIFALLSLSAALTYTFGIMVKDTRQGWVLFFSMIILFLGGLALIYQFELKGNPILANFNLSSLANLEGKEVRFGIFDSAFFSAATTATSCGAVNSLHDSFTPLGGMVLLINIMLGEIIIGGVGSGLYGILLFAILTVFLAGLMVGRTPEYLGKKIESKEIKMTVLAILILPVVIHLFTAIACVIPCGVKSILNPGPHGFSEILYAFSSAAANNGSAFAGLNSNTFFYNISTGISMLFGRYLSIIPTMAVAGSLVRKKSIPPSPGTFPTTGILFVFLLIGVILIVSGLIYFPALSLGPIVEHLNMIIGKVY